MLEDIYIRKKKGAETHADAKYFASSLGIDETLANFNLEYLVGSRLLEGDIIASIGTTKKMALAWDITNIGMRAVEGTSRSGFDVNFNIINIHGEVTQSQIASGQQVTQTQSISISSFEELYRYIDAKLNDAQKGVLNPMIKQLEADIKNDSVKPSLLRKIQETLTTYGPITIPIAGAIAKLAGLKP